MKKQTKITIALFTTVIVASLVMRLVPHPANFIPIGALALLSGVYIKSRWGIILPLVIMVVSDLIIGMHELVLFTWAGFILFGVIGWWIRKNKNILRITVGSLAGSVVFYLLTNFAVWAFTPLYNKTAAGLLDSYYMAIPFFRNAAIGDLFYAGIFFGVFEIVYYFFSVREKSSLTQSNTIVK